MFKSTQAKMYRSMDEGKYNYLKSKGEEFDTLWVNVGLYFVPYVNTGVDFDEEFKNKIVNSVAEYLKNMELGSVLSWDLEIVGKIYKQTTYDVVLTNSKGMKIVLGGVYFNENDLFFHQNMNFTNFN